MPDNPKPQSPKRTFGGKQAGAGRKPKAAADRLQETSIYVDWDTLQYLRSLPRADMVALKREASRVLKQAEINNRIL